MDLPAAEQHTENLTPWFVYILRCRDGSLYTGVTTSLERRLHEHNHSSRGARYTQGRRPVSLVYYETASDRRSAQRREYHIRQLSTAAKRALCARHAASRATP